ncbi:hypothetical protein ACHAXT_006857 [Thalassiosira profunda]
MNALGEGGYTSCARPSSLAALSGAAAGRIASACSRTSSASTRCVPSSKAPAIRCAKKASAAVQIGGSVSSQAGARKLLHDRGEAHMWQIVKRIPIAAPWPGIAWVSFRSSSNEHTAYSCYVLLFTLNSSHLSPSLCLPHFPHHLDGRCSRRGRHVPRPHAHTAAHAPLVPPPTMWPLIPAPLSPPWPPPSCHPSPSRRHIMMLRPLPRRSSTPPSTQCLPPTTSPTIHHGSSARRSKIGTAYTDPSRRAKMKKMPFLSSFPSLHSLHSLTSRRICSEEAEVTTMMLMAAGVAGERH